MKISQGEVLEMKFPPNVSVAFDIDAFDDAIRAHGVRFVHWRAMKDPVGMIDIHDSRRPEADHVASSNGMVYTKVGTLAALFTGNSKEIRAMTGGFLDAGTAQITAALTYCNNCREDVYLYPQDRLYLEDEAVLVPYHQHVEAHQTGRDRLKFPALKVQDLMDRYGRRHKEGIDFEVVGGEIVWREGHALGVEPDTGKGIVYSVRFLMRPFWYVERLIHEVRVAQQEHPITAERSLRRAQQCAIVQREYVYRGSEKNDPEAPPSPRMAQPPADGGFSPR